MSHQSHPGFQFLLTFLNELVFTEAALIARKSEVGHMVKPFTDSLVDWHTIFKKEHLGRSSVTRADAVLAVRNLDTTDFGKHLLAEAKDRNSSLWRRCFKQPVSAFIKTNLRTQCEIVRDVIPYPRPPDVAFPRSTPVGGLMSRQPGPVPGRWRQGEGSPTPPGVVWGLVTAHRLSCGRRAGPGGGSPSRLRASAGAW